MRFVTAPDLREYAQNERFRERLGAVCNRTISVNLAVPNPVGAVCNRTIGVNLVVFRGIFKMFQCGVPACPAFNAALVLESPFYFLKSLP